MPTHTSLSPTPEEQGRRDEVMQRILDYVEVNRTIKLPQFDPTIERPSDRYALISIGVEQNDFSGTVGDFRYQFEGEEDLLHLIITQHHGEPLTPEQGQSVASFVLRGLPTALIWLKPGQYSQHFYFGHDELIGKLEI
ncbi:MAG: hypothetical protein P4L46_19470 [Fimbriimonas sp.]|nr:hypothetical protein [Fimbriimonas sp.]